MENTKLVKQYLNKYFKQQYLEESDDEFKALVRILNKKDKQVKNLNFTHSSLPLKDKEGTGIEEYAIELIDIIQNPNNSNKEWQDVVIENTLEKINRR